MTYSEIQKKIDTISLEFEKSLVPYSKQLTNLSNTYNNKLELTKSKCRRQVSDRYANIDLENDEVAYNKLKKCIDQNIEKSGIYKEYWKSFSKLREITNKEKITKTIRINNDVLMKVTIGVGGVKEDYEDDEHRFYTNVDQMNFKIKDRTYWVNMDELMFGKDGCPALWVYKTNEFIEPKCKIDQVDNNNFELIEELIKY